MAQRGQAPAMFSQEVLDEVRGPCEKGRACLRETWPGWFLHVNALTLKMADPDDCVLAQLVPDDADLEGTMPYYAFLERYGKDDAWSEEHGFVVTLADASRGINRYPALEAEWLRIIAEERCAFESA